VLDGLFVTPAVTAIAEALASARADGKVAVIGSVKLARALAHNRDVVPVGLPARAAKKAPNHLADLSSVEPAALAAVVGVDIATTDAWAERLAEWSRVVRDGGAIIVVDRGHAVLASSRALCAGLSELEQRHAGRSVVTSGLVTHLD
jgi:hypothetical protein